MSAGEALYVAGKLRALVPLRRRVDLGDALELDAAARAWIAARNADAESEDSTVAEPPTPEPEYESIELIPPPLPDLSELGALAYALDGLYAGEEIGADCGIRDERLRQHVIEHLQALGDDAAGEIVRRIAGALFLTPDARAYGYGPEDADGFVEWVTGELVP